MSVHSFKKTVATYNGQRVTGFWEGDDVVNVEPRADIGNLIIGADGRHIFNQSSDDSVLITLKLQSSSPTHKLLMESLEKQKTGIPKGVPFAYHDQIRNEGGSTSETYIVKQPATQGGTNATVREWQLAAPRWNNRIPTGL